MLGDLQPDGRKLEDLPTFTVFGRKFSSGLVHGCAALRTKVFPAEAMLDEVIGIGDALKGVTTTPFLPARFAAGFATETFGLGRIGEVARIGRWRLAAGARVALQFSDFRFETLYFGLQGRNPFEKLKAQLSYGLRVGFSQRNKLLFAWMILLHKRELTL